MWVDDKLKHIIDRRLSSFHNNSLAKSYRYLKKTSGFCQVTRRKQLLKKKKKQLPKLGPPLSHAPWVTPTAFPVDPGALTADSRLAPSPLCLAAVLNHVKPE